MMGPELSPALRPLLRVQQIIAVALPAGVALFLVVAVFVRQGNAEPVEQFGLMSVMSTVVALVSMAASAIVPAVFTTVALGRIARGEFGTSPELAPRLTRLFEQAGDDAYLMVVQQTRLIVGMAILEGAAFFATTAYMIEGSQLALAAAGVLLLMLVAHFPTAGRTAHWLQRQRQRLEDARSLAGQ